MILPTQMMWVLEALLLGGALAMDAFSVSMVQGMRLRGKDRAGTFRIAGTFALFQWAMPLAGYGIVLLALSLFERLRGYVPYLTFVLLFGIGLHMLRETWLENTRGASEETTEDSEEAADGPERLTWGRLILLAVATSIDALSAGVAMTDLDGLRMFLSAVIIGAVTLLICLTGAALGSRIGLRLAGKAGYVGGTVLIILALARLIN